ncbi:conserved virulence factor C family protein [Bacillus salitolerans]|uniref:Conserved virulence factor C family protein n=1 Tax=Bacillus salitolerans TaxID=1437434 RepID=A0ABW4LTB7_9BACI
MNIKSIEPTPSPNTMKVLLDRELPSGERNNYTKENCRNAPSIINDILNIDGIKGIYHVADFLAIERNARYDWKDILAKVREVFGEKQGMDNNTGELIESYGEVKVFVQIFRGIPMQLKISNGEEEIRVGLPERFKIAAMEAETSASNVVVERQWKEQGIRYGSIEEVGKEVAEEMEAAYPKERLDRLVLQSQSKDTTTKRQSYTVTLTMLKEEDWTKRYAHLEQMTPTEDDLPVLELALKDEKPSIRRLATVYLGMIESKSVLPLLYKALEDKSVTVRRTAGDCLSDIGDPDAIVPMVKALKDPNKLVRWRAAMFLYEVGDESALSALKEAENDPEFEVSMQIKLAIERIEGGEEAKGSVWKQMTESRKQD